MKYSDEALITLSGGEHEIEFIHSHNFYHVQNLGTTSIKISTFSNINGRDDGVFEVPAGGSATISAGKDNKIYVYGSGKINVASSDSNNSPFRNPSKGGDSGGGGTGTNNYDDLINQPMMEGVVLKGDMTFEQLGWKALTKEDAVEIVNNAFSKLDPYTILAEIPLNGSFDGNGYELRYVNENTETSFTDDGLHCDDKSNFVIAINSVDYDIQDIEKLIVSFDFKIDTGAAISTSRFRGIFTHLIATSMTSGASYTSPEIYWQKLEEHIVSIGFRYHKGSSFVETPIIDIPDDGTWHSVTFTEFSGYTKGLIKIDDMDEIEVDIGTSKLTYVRNVFSFGVRSGTVPTSPVNGSGLNGYIKNIKFMIPKEATDNG